MFLSVMSNQTMSTHCQNQSQGEGEEEGEVEGQGVSHQDPDFHRCQENWKKKKN